MTDPKIEVTFINLSEVKLRDIIREEMQSFVNAVLEQQNRIEAEDTLFDVSGVAKYMNLSTATIYSKVSRGELPCMKKGKQLYFSKKAITEYIHSGNKNTNTQTPCSDQQYDNEKRVSLFRNDRKDKDSQPDYNGSCQIESLFDTTCEAVTNDEIHQWLEDYELPRTEDNIEKGITAISMKKLGWAKTMASATAWADAMAQATNALIKSQTRK
jgi:excisionase family DNA binding protein